MTGELRIYRRRGRGGPMRRRRVGVALHGGAGAAPPVEFPGIEIREPEGGRGALVSGSLAALLHVGVIGGLLLLTWLVPPEKVEEIIREVRLVRDEPAPKREPAPAPKALAERRSVQFAPQAQAVAPQVVNPSVVARAAPAVEAQQLEMEDVGQVAAPRQIERSRVVTERVSAVRSVAAARAAAVEVDAAAVPALRGPIEVEAPVGPSVGPRQVVVGGGSVGTGATTFQIGGSSVEEGVVTGRDVLGSPDGEPLANVNTRVGDGLLGSGGSGTGAGGGNAIPCLDRPEVKSYLGTIHDRTLARWVVPSGAQPNQQVTLRFTLDAAGSAVSVDLLDSADRALGASAIQALRSAAPFPPMPDDVRCLARTPIRGTFRNPVGG